MTVETNTGPSPSAAPATEPGFLPLAGKIVGGDLSYPGVTLITVEVPGRVPVQMSTLVSLSAPAPASPRPEAEDLARFGPYTPECDGAAPSPSPGAPHAHNCASIEQGKAACDCAPGATTPLTEERPTSQDVLREGGDWLAAARTWVQWNCHNGSMVTWGSAAVLSPPLTIAQVEEVAAAAVAADRSRSLRRLRADEEGRATVLEEVAQHFDRLGKKTQLGATFRGGPLDGASVYNVHAYAARVVRALAIRDAIAAASAPSPSLPDAPLPTHRCKVCGALWRLNPAEPTRFPPSHPFHRETWSLVSRRCGKCCDNVAMGDQIEPITEFRRHERPSEAEQNAIEFRAGCAPLHDGRDATREDYNRGPMTWGVSTDEESFRGSYATKEEALAAAPSELNLEPGQRFWVGGGALWRPLQPYPADRIIEFLGECAGEACGEIAEDWPDASLKDETALQDEIHAVVVAWLKRTGNLPKFYCCETTEERTYVPAPRATDDNGKE